MPVFCREDIYFLGAKMLAPDTLEKKKIQHLPINHHTRKVWLGSVIRRIIINAPLKWKEVRNPPVALELS